MSKKVPCDWNGNHYESIKEAAEANGYTYSALYQLLKRGYTCDADKKRQNLGEKWSKEDVLFIREKHNDGWTISDIVQHFANQFDIDRISDTTLHSEIRQILTGKTYARYGGEIISQDESNLSRLSDEDVIYIRQQIKQNRPVYELSEEMKLTKDIVYNVAHGNTYNHVDEIEDPIDFRIPPQMNPKYMIIPPAERDKIRDYYSQFDTTFNVGNKPDGYITYEKMAARYGVDISYISRIVNGER